jgi:KUP system potassium uptake protein
VVTAGLRLRTDVTRTVILAGSSWHWAPWKLVVFAVVFGGLELVFFAANVSKIVHGGWLPLVLALAITLIMLTWQRGRNIVTQRRIALEGSLNDFVEKMRADPPPRVTGTAVFPHPTKDTTPLALRANVEFNHVLHDHVVIVSVMTENVPHIPIGQRVTIDDLGYQDDAISHLTIRLGFQDEQDIPKMLRYASRTHPELDFEPDELSYFLSRINIERGPSPVMAPWRKRLFIGLAHNAATPAAYFKLPDNRTVVMGSRVEL